MRTYLITTNDFQGNSCLFSCNKKIESELLELEYLGGFKRFNIELYSERKEKQSLSLNDFKKWLKEKVFV